MHSYQLIQKMWKQASLIAWYYRSFFCFFFFHLVTVTSTYKPRYSRSLLMHWCIVWIFRERQWTLTILYFFLASVFMETMGEKWIYIERLMLFLAGFQKFEYIIAFFEKDNFMECLLELQAPQVHPSSGFV